MRDPPWMHSTKGRDGPTTGECRRFFKAMEDNLKPIAEPVEKFSTKEHCTMDFDVPDVKDLGVDPAYYRGSVSLSKRTGMISTNIPILIKDLFSAKDAANYAFEKHCENYDIHEMPFHPYADAGFLWLQHCKFTPQFLQKLKSWYPYSNEPNE